MGDPKSDLEFWVNRQDAWKTRLAGNFTTQPYITHTVRSKIAEDAVFQDVLAVSNPAMSGFGGEGVGLILSDYW